VFDNRVFENGVFENRVFENGVFENRVFENRVFENRVFENRVFEKRVFENRVFEKGVFENGVFENRVLRRIFARKRDEGTGEWRKLHNEELHDLYSASNIVRVIKSRRMRWAGHVARLGKGRDVYRVLVGNPEGKRPLGRPRRRWEDNIKIDIQEVGCRGMDWIELIKVRDTCGQL
jgi:hypothetical protein